MFYPANPRTLASTVDRLLADVGPVDTWEHRVPKAVIAPHAGYPYSGPIAAKAFATLIPAAGRIERVVLIGPSHRMWFDGIASADADRFDTPLGPVRVSAPLDPGVFPSTGAHAEEHALEVELPFIQRVLGDVEVVPLLASEAPPDAVASVLDHLWGNAGTVFVVSKIGRAHV